MCDSSNLGLFVMVQWEVVLGRLGRDCNNGSSNIVIVIRTNILENLVHIRHCESPFYVNYCT